MLYGGTSCTVKFYKVLWEDRGILSNTNHAKHCHNITVLSGLYKKRNDKLLPVYLLLNNESK